MLRESSVFSLIPSWSFTNASLGALSAVLVSVSRFTPRRWVTRDECSGPAHPAGRAGAVTPSKFSVHVRESGLESDSSEADSPRESQSRRVLCSVTHWAPQSLMESATGQVLHLNRGRRLQPRRRRWCCLRLKAMRCTGQAPALSLCRTPMRLSGRDPRRSVPPLAPRHPASCHSRPGALRCCRAAPALDWPER